MSTAARFVGRAGELAALVELLTAATAGHAAFGLVGGPAGIGKTRLLAELTRVARGRGWAVVGATAPAVDGAPAFWPWRQLIRTWAAEPTGPQLAGALAAHGSHLTRMLPELQAAPAPHLPARTAEERFAAFERFAAMLADAAGPGPGTLLLIDDLHRVDAASLALFASVVALVPEGRLVLVGAHRIHELATRPGGAELRTAVARHAHGTTMTLGGLSSGEVDTALHAMLHRRPDPATVAAVHARTRGNPLFVHELGRLLDAGEAADTHLPGGLPGVLPDVVRDVIGQHLDVLSPAVRQTLRVAAVLGPTIDPDTVAEVVGAPVASVVAQLDEAVAGGVVTTGAEGRFTFVHDLFPETLVLEPATSSRARTHLRAAAVLEARTPPPLGEIAQHRLAALPLGDRDAAAAAAHAAGHDALAHLAFEDASRLFECALTAAPDDLPVARRARS